MAIMVLGVTPMAAFAQGVAPAAEAGPQPVIITPKGGEMAEVTPGRVGQRQSSADASVKAGVQPMARVSSRVANRIQSRIRNRIDRNYDPMANAALPFGIAADRVRSTTNVRR